MRVAHVITIVVGMIFVSSAAGQDDAENLSKDQDSLARLQFMRDSVQKMVVKPIKTGDERDLTIKAQPLLRYNDSARNVADSAVWRVGTTGRPTAIVTSEVYGPSNDSYRLSHEYLAVDNPQLTIKCGGFVWTPPPATTLTFLKFESEERPAENPKLRLTQIKRLAKKFTTGEQLGSSKIELRVLPTPIDRYEPSDKPHSDGAIFAAVWGVNPEALLFIETDGETWTYAWARMGAAMVWASLDDKEVWNAPPIASLADLGKPTAPYANSGGAILVPASLFDKRNADKKP